MSGHLKAQFRGSFGVLAFLFFSSNALALSVSPSLSPNGNYTVSWSTTLGCTYDDNPPFYSYQCTSLQENGVDVAASGYSLPVTGKAAGSYEYQVYYIQYVYGQPNDWGTVEGPASVTVGTPPPRDPLPTQLTYQYQTRAGDINSDGRVDLFVQRTSGGVPGNGVLEKVLLWQNPSGSFSPVVDAYYTGIAAAWPVSSATPIVQDINVDGYVDVALKGVPAVTGAAHDQIVFSSAAPLVQQPRGLRAVDTSLKKFAANALDYATDQSYFVNNVPITYYSGYYYYYSCGFSPYYYGMIEGYYYGGWGCGIYVNYFSGYYYNYAVFSGEAVAIWTNEASNQAGTVSNSQSTENAQQSAESVLTVPVGGWPMEEVFGSAGEHTDPDVRRGLETFWSILGVARAYATDVPTQEAPPQVDRSTGTVYITGHHVFGLGILPIHTALEYRIAGVPIQIQAISAISWPAPLVGPFLQSVSDRPKEFMNMTRGTVSDPGNPVAALYWAELRQADNNYDDQLPYLAIPFGPFYNSNGYTHGLIQFTGGVTSPDPNMMNGFVGGAHFVPGINFQ